MLGLSLNTLGALALSQLSFTCFFFFVYHRQQLIGRLLALYSFSLAAYLLAQMAGPESNAALFYALNRIATVAPAALWLLALYLFVDNPKVSTPVWAVMIAYVVLRGIGALIGVGDTPFMEGIYVIGYVLPQLAMLGFSVHAVYLAIQDIGNDLVESRRRVRVPFVISMGVLVSAILMRGFATAVQHYSPATAITSNAIPLEYLFFYVFLISLAFNVSTTGLRSGALQVIVLPPEQQLRHLSPVPNGSVKVDNPALVEKIFDVLKREQLYAHTGLTIGDLAKRLSMQEYRLRRVINKQLGYRNFNQLLNAFRIEEACRRLENPAEQREQIASIAYDVGYSALSSFNKAFKDIHQLTPTQYRDAAAQDTALQGDADAAISRGYARTGRS